MMYFNLCVGTLQLLTCLICWSEGTRVLLLHSCFSLRSLFFAAYVEIAIIDNSLLWIVTSAGSSARCAKKWMK